MFQRLLFFCLFLLPTLCPVTAQTVIDLQQGGRVRAKTIDDYKAERRMAEIELRDSADYVALLHSGITAFATDSLDAAERYFKKAMRLRPSNAGNRVVRYYLASIEAARGHLKQADQQLADLLRDFPDYLDARLLRAGVRLQLGRHAEALDDAKTVLAADDHISLPMRSQALFVSSGACYSLRRYAECRDAVQQVLRLQPDHVGARILEAMTYYYMQQPAEAINRLNLLISAHPTDVDALQARAGLHHELQHFSLARADYDSLISLQPADASLYVERARVLLSLGEKTAARRDLDKAVSLGMPTGMVQPLLMLTK